MSHDNQYLYTAGMDGTFCVFAIADKDRTKRELTNYSQEILIKKTQRDQLQLEITNLRENIKTEKKNREEEMQALNAKYEKRSKDIEREMEDKALQGRLTMERIEQETREMERRYQEEIQRAMEAHSETLEKRAND